MSFKSYDSDPRIEAVRTGNPVTCLLACVECGVLVWDFDAHYRHAHPATPAPSRAEHIASLTAMLKETEWQIGRDQGSQWLAGELYERGARAPHGHSHPASQEPSEDDRAMQIAREIARVHTFTTVDALSIANAALALALASHSVLDPEKVAEVIDRFAESKGDIMHDGDSFGIRYDQNDDVARALCEAAKRGELT